LQSALTFLQYTGSVVDLQLTATISSHNFDVSFYAHILVSTDAHTLPHVYELYS